MLYPAQNFAWCTLHIRGFPGGSDGKASAYNAGDPGSILGLGRSSGEGNGNPLQCSCLENSRDGEAWWAAVYGVAQSRTRLKWLSSSSYAFLQIFMSLQLFQNSLNKTWDFFNFMCMLCHFSHVQLFATVWTVAHQALLSLVFSRQEYWSGLLCPTYMKVNFIPQTKKS